MLPKSFFDHDRHPLTDFLNPPLLWQYNRTITVEINEIHNLNAIIGVIKAAFVSPIANPGQ